MDRNFKQNPEYGYFFKGWGGRVAKADIGNHWRTKDALGDLTEFFCRVVNTEERLEASRPADSLDVLTEPCEKPIQSLAANTLIERKLSDVCSQAFGLPLLLDRWSGKMIRIRCGEIPRSKPWTMPFLKEVRAMPRLESQGDGVRSFVGCILESVLAPHPVVFIDEPEAFLHPQHARTLGRLLASDRPTGRQLFIATHGIHVLLGLLDSPQSKIRVVRLRRDGDSNPTCELKQDQIKNVWQDSFLRASNVLEGIFHEMVVLCEGDADCRFYSRVLEAVFGSDSRTRRPDVMFTSCGGKSRMPLVIQAFKALDVPVRTVVDFDILQNGQDLRRLVEAYGQPWRDIEPHWKKVHGALQNVAPPRSLAQVRSEMSKLLEGAKGTHLDEKTRKDLMDCLRIASPWAAAKRGGKSSLPSGDATAAYDELTRRLSCIGVFIVHCGELERFVPSVGAHGPGWVSEVLHRDLASDQELNDAREFVRDIVGLERDEKGLSASTT